MSSHLIQHNGRRSASRHHSYVRFPQTKIQQSTLKRREMVSICELPNFQNTQLVNEGQNHFSHDHNHSRYTPVHSADQNNFQIKYKNALKSTYNKIVTSRCEI